MMSNLVQYNPQWGQQAVYGTAVAIRLARPDDVQPILDMHQRLSTDSLFLRYLVPYLPAYVPAHLRDICTRPAGQGAALVATRRGQIIGLGYYVVKPEQSDTAEPALLIEDQFQGQGIGKRLFNELIVTARARGVRFFDALTHTSNRQMLHLLRRSGQPVSSKRDGDHMAVLLSLTASGAV